MQLDTAKKLGNLNEFLETLNCLNENLNPKFALRDYQKDAFAGFGTTNLVVTKISQSRSSTLREVKIFQLNNLGVSKNSFRFPNFLRLVLKPLLSIKKRLHYIKFFCKVFFKL